MTVIDRTTTQAKTLSWRGLLPALGAHALFFGLVTSGCIVPVATETGEFEEATGELVSGEPLGPATLRETRLCFRIAPDFVDWGSNDIATRPDYVARGIKFDLVSDLGVIRDPDYANLNTGCKRVELDPNRTYEIRLYSEATAADGNTIFVGRSRATPEAYRWTVDEAFSPASRGLNEITGAGSYVLEANQGGTIDQQVQNTLLAAIHTLHRNRTTKNEQFLIYTEDNDCEGDSSCFRSNENNELGPMVLITGARNDRFVVSHELGHLALFLRAEAPLGSAVGHPTSYGLQFVPELTSPCANGPLHTPGNNGGLPLGSEESGNAAFEEGLAQYYSASVWNDSTSTECRYRGLDCYEPGRAFDACYSANGLDHVLWTGFERDWLTAFWAAERQTGCGIDLEAIFDIVVAADPPRWMNNQAKSMLLLHAGVELTGDEYSCFLDTIDGRIAF